MSTTTTTHDELIGRIRDVLAPVVGDTVRTVDADADLATALGDGYDSLTAMEAVTRVEEQFGFEVDFVADDVRHWFATIDRIASFTSDRLDDAAALGGDR